MNKTGYQTTFRNIFTCCTYRCCSDRQRTRRRSCQNGRCSNTFIINSRWVVTENGRQFFLKNLIVSLTLLIFEWRLFQLVNAITVIDVVNDVLLLKILQRVSLLQLTTTVFGGKLANRPLSLCMCRPLTCVFVAVTSYEPIDRQRKHKSNCFCVLIE